MKVYLTYFRYDRGEQYSVYNLDTSLQRSWKSWKETDLPNFLGCGPDDVSQLYLVRCNLTKSEVEVIKNFMSSTKDYDEDFYDLMEKIDGCSEEIWSTSGDELWEVIDFVGEYCKTYLLYNLMSKYIPSLNFNDEDELRNQISDILCEDENLWGEILKIYIKNCYR